MDISSCLGPIEATDTAENGDASEEKDHMLTSKAQQSRHRTNRQKRPTSMSVLTTMTDSEVSHEVTKTVSEWRGTRQRRNTEEEKRQTWRRSLNSPIQQFFWTDIYPIEQDSQGEMMASPVIEENAVYDEDEIALLSVDEGGNPVFSPALYAARLGGNQEAIGKKLVNSEMNTSESKAESGHDDGEEVVDVVEVVEERLAERVQVVSIQDF